MIKVALSLALLCASLSSYAQEAPPPPPPMGGELTLPPSAPDASPPQPEFPVGVSQPNPDFQNEVDRRNEMDRRDDGSHHAAAGGDSSGTNSKVKKLKIAKMIQGPAIAPDAWKKGHWFHGKHDGSFAWWWVVDQTWFHYAKFVAPYPDHEKRQVYLPNSGSSSFSSVAPGHR